MWREAFQAEGKEVPVEAPKPAAEEPKTDGGKTKKYLEISFTDADKNALKEAEDAGNKLLGITVFIQKTFMLL